MRSNVTCKETAMTRPFEGIRVIDVTHVLAGPFATYQLSVLAAHAIKAEHPPQTPATAPTEPRTPPATRSNPPQHGPPLPDASLQQARDHARPQDASGSRHPQKTRRHRRRVRGELPARRVRGARLGIRGARGDQSAADLCLVLGLRPARP